MTTKPKEVSEHVIGAPPDADERRHCPACGKRLFKLAHASAPDVVFGFICSACMDKHTVTDAPLLGKELN